MHLTIAAVVCRSGACQKDGRHPASSNNTYIPASVSSKEASPPAAPAPTTMASKPRGSLTRSGVAAKMARDQFGIHFFDHDGSRGSAATENFARATVWMIRAD